MKRLVFSITAVTLFLASAFIVTPSCTSTVKSNDSIADTVKIDTAKIDSTKIVDTIFKK